METYQPQAWVSTVQPDHSEELPFMVEVIAGFNRYYS
jgi:hypothetical protein